MENNLSHILTNKKYSYANIKINQKYHLVQDKKWACGHLLNNTSFPATIVVDEKEKPRK